jgi:hypothetical protein
VRGSDGLLLDCRGMMDGPQRALVIKVRNNTMSGRKNRIRLPFSRIIQWASAEQRALLFLKHL